MRASKDELGQPSISYQVIRRFILSKQFESLFDLQLLARILNDIIKECESATIKQEEHSNVLLETKVRRQSCSSDVSDRTVLYNLDTKNSVEKSDQQTDKTSGNKKDFFSSDTDTNSTSLRDSEETRSRQKSDLTETKPETISDTTPETTPETMQDKQETDEEERELQRLLRMSEVPPQTRTNPSAVDSQKEEKEKKAKSKEEEISLLDCLESENCNENQAPDEEETENTSDFFSIVNNQVKEAFLLTSEESAKSSAEEEKEEIKKQKKKKKPGKKVEGKKDELSEFRFTLQSNEGDVNKKTVESDDSVKCVQHVKKKKKDSEESEPTIESDSGSDIQQVYSKTESSPNKGRKNIKKILKKENLQVETKQALKMETERKKRVAERKKVFEELFPNGEADSKLVLDFDPETKKEVVVVDEKLTRQLKPHQKEGVRFMWDNCFESVKRLEEDSGSGCVLAHCMGLGKTLQVIALIHTVMTHDLGVHTVLIVCPLSTVANWIREFRTWQRQCVRKIKPIDLIPCKSRGSRLAKVNAWSKDGGVLVISYGMFQSLIKDEKIAEKFLDPDVVVCDEGHMLKNSNSARSKYMSGIKTLRRIILTGTPLQNNLMEYYCMVQFVKPNILGTVKEFKNRFFHPINNGQFEDSTQLDVKIMKRRAHVLHSMLDGFIQRFGYSVLTPFLPEKQEYVISIALTETQENIYRYFIGQCNQENRELLKDFHWMQKVWTHPRVLLTHSARRGDDSMKDQWEKYVKESDYTDIRSSGKLYLLFSILRRCKEIEDKVLVFSQSLMSLDLIEFFLRKANEQKTDSWVFGEDYFRLDGSTSSENRNAFFQKFNDVNDKRFRLFLVSTKAGGLGVNLVAANRVVVFDVSWNPTHDVQSIFRVYRFGQKKPCFIYRFLAAGTMEEKIYKRQVTKLSLAHRILDEHQIERHYTMGNLQELYRYDPIPKSEWKIPKLPKDGLFADILSRNLDMIVGYHEHDSLLENKEEEELTEEDRKAAWEDYEKEKLVPQYPLVNGMPVVAFNGEGSSTSRVPARSYKPKVGTSDNQNEPPLCKIVDVRTLHNEQMQPDRLLEIGRSLGLKPYMEESVEGYRRRVDIITREFFEGRLQKF